MDNQHRKISGYRELSAAEIDLMNRIKAKGGELLDLQRELMDSLNAQAQHKKAEAEVKGLTYVEGAKEELDRFIAAEPQRWASIGRTDIQTGIMALVRAVAQPAGV